MTAQGRLNRRMRWVVGTMHAGLGLFFAGIPLGMVFGRLPGLAAFLPGLAAALGSVLAAHFIAFRCPRCRVNLAPLVMPHGWLSVDPRVCSCPYCGAGLDGEPPAEVSVGARRGAQSAAPPGRGGG